MSHNDSQPMKELAWLANYYRSHGHIAESEEITKSLSNKHGSPTEANVIVLLDERNNKENAA